MKGRTVIGFFLACAIGAAALTAGCEKEGAAERAGKELDRAVGDLKDAAKRATQ